MNDHKTESPELANSSRRTFISGLAVTAVAAAVSTSALAAGASSIGSKKAAATGAGIGKATAAGKNPVTKLNNGVEMPVFGVGTYALPDFQTADDINFALRNGYRLIDTAESYRNEKGVGEGIVRSGVKRAEVFVTTKLSMKDFGYDAAMREFDGSMNRLGLDYLDLYLLHWPMPTDFGKTIAAWKAMERLYADKRIRAIGVSNFEPEHLKRLMDNSDVVPAVNQIELHPYLSQKSVCAADERYGIKTQCWSPIGGDFVNHPKEWTDPVRVLEDLVIVNLALKHGKSAAQIVLRWHLQQGRIAIPKSQHYDRLLANIDVFNFELPAADMAAIDALNRNLRGGPEPQTFNIPALKAFVEKANVRVY